MKVFLKNLNNYFIFLYLAVIIFDLFKTIYPERFQIYVANISYNLIYYYSKMQIIVKNIHDNLPKNIKDILFSVYVYF